MKIILLVFCLGIQIFSVFSKCGYEACTKSDPDALNVHIVAHSHFEIGWLKTIDEYYYENVQHIISSVVTALQKNAERKFIFVESFFLWKWWNAQNKQTKQQFMNLLNNGRIEIAGGGWTMNDEAITHYQPIIDQFTHGLQFLKKTFGSCGRPRVGWQIDSYGHTREMASIFAHMGYDALFLSRVNWRDKEHRLSTQTAELIWKGNDHLGNSSMIFTHILYNHYDPPPGFYFDVTSEDDPLIDDTSSTEYNLENKVEHFLRFVNNQTDSYRTNNIIVTMGKNFSYQNADYGFNNLDALIRAFKTNVHKDVHRRRINLFYSTPACYIKAVNEVATSSEMSFEVKTDDFVPYSSEPHKFWSGFYTSRPSLKLLTRQANHLLQVAKQLAASINDITLKDGLNELKSVVAIMQHHNGITGTSRQRVADDYVRMLTKAMHSVHDVINKVIPKLLAKWNKKINLNFSSCLLANISVCEQSQSSRFVVAVYNPLSHRVSFYVRVPVNSHTFEITGPQGIRIEYQITPSILYNFDYVKGMNIGYFDLTFLARDIPPLGIQVYYIKVISQLSDNFTTSSTSTTRSPIPQVILKSKAGMKVEINRITGLVQKITSKRYNEEHNVNIRQNFKYYVGAQETNRSSGTYIFRPSPCEPFAKEFVSNIIVGGVYKGIYTEECHQTFNSWIKQIVRVYHTKKYVEFDWIIGPINPTDAKSLDILTVFKAEDFTSEYFKTDSNGREMLKRVISEYTNDEPVAGNYFPVSSRISIENSSIDQLLAVVTDRPQGGASLEFGEIELMIHRRLTTDDGLGLEETLQETEFGEGLVVRGQHQLVFGSIGVTNGERKMVSQEKLMGPWVFLSDAECEECDLDHKQDLINFEYAGLTRDLPTIINILTLEPWNKNQVLLRVENIFESWGGTVAEYINFQLLFTEFYITELEEYTLGANQKLNENAKLKWKKEDYLSSNDNYNITYNINNKQFNKKYTSEKFKELPLVNLQNMEIKTFLATVNYYRN